MKFKTENINTTFKINFEKENYAFKIKDMENNVGISNILIFFFLAICKEEFIFD